MTTTTTSACNSFTPRAWPGLAARGTERACEGRGLGQRPRPPPSPFSPSTNVGSSWGFATPPHAPPRSYHLTSLALHSTLVSVRRLDKMGGGGGAEGDLHVDAINPRCVVQVGTSTLASLGWHHCRHHRARQPPPPLSHFGGGGGGESQRQQRNSRSASQRLHRSGCLRASFEVA